MFIRVEEIVCSSDEKFALINIEEINTVSDEHCNLGQQNEYHRFAIEMKNTTSIVITEKSFNELCSVLSILTLD